MLESDTASLLLICHEFIDRSCVCGLWIEWKVICTDVPRGLFMGSGYVRRSGCAGGKPDWNISGAAFRGHADDTDAVAGCAPRSTVSVDCGLGLRGCCGGRESVFWAAGLGMAVLAMIIAFLVINLIHAYHPPVVALASIPVLLRPGHWFPLLVVLPFTAAAVGSAAAMSKWLRGWPEYRKSLRDLRASSRRLGRNAFIEGNPSCAHQKEIIV